MGTEPVIDDLHLRVEHPLLVVGTTETLVEKGTTTRGRSLQSGFSRDLGTPVRTDLTQWPGDRTLLNVRPYDR